MISPLDVALHYEAELLQLGNSNAWFSILKYINSITEV